MSPSINVRYQVRKWELKTQKCQKLWKLWDQDQIIQSVSLWWWDWNAVILACEDSNSVGACSSFRSLKEVADTSKRCQNLVWPVKDVNKLVKLVRPTPSTYIHHHFVSCYLGNSLIYSERRGLEELTTASCPFFAELAQHLLRPRVGFRWPQPTVRQWKI